jgi:anti-sigma B factor antagonist
MDFKETSQGTYTVIAPEGKLNLVSAPPIKARIDDLVNSGMKRIVIDLSEVSYVDSSGLGALIGGLKAARQAEGDLRISGAGTQIKAVLALTNLDRILAPYASVEEAAREW